MCICMEQTCYTMPCPGWPYCKVGDGKFTQVNWLPFTIVADDPNTIYLGCCCSKSEDIKAIRKGVQFPAPTIEMQRS